MAGGVRTRVRRAFPYLVIAVAGFALAYLIVYVLLLRTSPPPQATVAEDTTNALLPVKTDVAPLPSDTAPASVAAPSAPTMVMVPDVSGMSLDDAQAQLTPLGLSVIVRRDTSSFQPPNTILRQLPEAGERVVSGTAILLTASMFPPVTSADSARVR